MIRILAIPGMLLTRLDKVGVLGIVMYLDMSRARPRFYAVKKSSAPRAIPTSTNAARPLGLAKRGSHTIEVR